MPSPDSKIIGVSNTRLQLHWSNVDLQNSFTICTNSLLWGSGWEAMHSFKSHVVHISHIDSPQHVRPESRKSPTSIVYRCGGQMTKTSLCDVGCCPRA